VAFASNREAVRLVHSPPFFRLSSVTLTLALLFALAGLFAVDRTLAGSSVRQGQVEAAESGALVEGFLTVHAEALQAIRVFYLDSTRQVSSSAFRRIVAALTHYAPSFRYIWITDSAGRVVEHEVFGPGLRVLPYGLDIDTAHVLALGRLAAEARRTRRLLTSPPGPLLTNERGVVLLLPMYFGDRFVGFVGGMISSGMILRSVVERRPEMRGQFVILAGADTVAAMIGRRSLQPIASRASSSIRIPGGGTWELVVLQPSSYADVRFLVWSVGLVTLGALIVTLLHERRQGIRLAERSSELERLSAELLRANRAKSEFLANVSHELRTPLNAIVGFVELLRDGVYGELRARQIAPVERIASSAAHLRQLVDQILDLAKMAAGRLEVHPEPVDLRPFVLNVVSEVESLIAERGLNLSIAVSASLPRIHTDPMHLRQILVNLIGNAIKFTPSGGIAIRARLIDGRSPVPPVRPSLNDLRMGTPAPPRTGSNGWIILQVADTGIGIAPADRERVFEEFEQVNAGPRSDSIQRGTGLGLPISRRLARLLGGDITVESELGKGSTFTVWLPVAPVRESLPQVPQSLPVSAPAAGGSDPAGADVLT
jgi:signal transduction histidine kinase